MLGGVSRRWLSSAVRSAGALHRRASLASPYASTSSATAAPNVVLHPAETKLKLHNELLKSHNGVFRPCNAGDNYFLRYMSTTGQPEISDTEESSIEFPVAEHPPRIKFKRPDKTAKYIMNILDKEEVGKVQAEREIPDIRPGYIIQLKVEVPENKRRTSSIKGIVIARRNAGLNTTFRLRRMVAGVGIESVYPLYSPNIKEIKVLDKKRVRRAKLYYLRERMNPFKP
ncbi:50S ribosomal protein L19-1, chloroplastic-like [Zingiber officinale]|uniref:Ribosomal protein L19 n=1 Tax=Zingiber officinale TaxID=94328 RepID=A0A8J5HFF8_ZINOF|nr:50S ribosomal protein L19-1, chloroplastic-like [Zingiber officinale]KAG6523211.1 hypothetical protein ZIOFF_013064 [Zingiber officinale]